MTKPSLSEFFMLEPPLKKSIWGGDDNIPFGIGMNWSCVRWSLRFIAVLELS